MAATLFFPKELFMIINDRIIGLPYCSVKISRCTPCPVPAGISIGQTHNTGTKILVK